MTPDFNNALSAQFIYEQAKLLAACAGILWAAFKGFTWVRDILGRIMTGVDSAATDNKSGFESLVGEIRNQTVSTVRELQELRSDFRTFYTQPDPIMTPVHARSTRKRKSVSVRTKAKEKAPVRVTKAVKKSK